MYQDNHMEDTTKLDPNEPNISKEKEDQPKTPFQIYCDEHPDAIECRIYEN